MQKKYDAIISAGFRAKGPAEIEIREFNPKTQEDKLYKVEVEEAEKLLIKSFKKFGHIEKAKGPQRYDRITFEI